MSERLRLTTARLRHLVNQALHNRSQYQAQSMVEIDKLKHWACPVYHPEIGATLSINFLLKVHDTVTWTASLTNELGRLPPGVEKDRPERKKLEEPTQ